ncbi:hypothetical protein OESDEN_03448, partial [Oesophagostomum dentatum]
LIVAYSSYTGRTLRQVAQKRAIKGTEERAREQSIKQIGPSTFPSSNGGDYFKNFFRNARYLDKIYFSICLGIYSFFVLVNMALAFVWLCPVVIALYSILCLLICFSLSAYYHGVPTTLPFISELATKPVAGELYSMMTNHIAVLGAVWIYLKHREFVSYFSRSKDRNFYRRLSFFHLCIGLAAVSCLQIGVNFFEQNTIGDFVLLKCATGVLLTTLCMDASSPLSHCKRR